MAGRSNNRPILTACVAAGLAVSLAGCGSARTGFLAPPRLPADAPPIQSTATAPNDAGIPTLGSGSAYSAQMTPAAVPGVMPGVDAILARLDELDSRITGLQKQFQAAEPAISRLTRIDGDIRALLAQMEGAVAARSEEAPVAKAVTSRPGASSAPPADGRPDRSAETTLTMATPIRPSASLGTPLGAPTPGASSGPPSGSPSGLPSGPLADPGSLRLSLSPTPALPQPRTQPQRPAQQPATQQPATQQPAALTAAVHLASYRSIENARDGWRILQRRYPNELGTLVPMILEVDLGSGRGRMLRLQASALTPGEARTICDRLKQAGQYCIPTADAGTPLGTAVATLR
ncbi:hypothetical protein [Oceanibaculum nanhaiense]|uniref:hypothetical protein n=1 Tax=Oceanibaculum nanhaiense TaxID=1909734 RepID=UPI00396E638F